ncbi:hypothetical protein B0H16DRAFT_1486318 [Mycena metata]|uniref:GATA-type domain-containing protein n=1 Tax=Mycena metata TaxID=1033252 RepID=A0AAD7GK36_9AGAR|nr:hypothetical protein B0H16DRAFT_1486318 [Mycena metata]
MASKFEDYQEDSRILLLSMYADSATPVFDSDLPDVRVDNIEEVPVAVARSPQCANPNCGVSASIAWHKSVLVPGGKVCNNCVVLVLALPKRPPREPRKRPVVHCSGFDGAIVGVPFKSKLNSENNLCRTCHDLETTEIKANRPPLTHGDCANCGFEFNGKGQLRYNSVLDPGKKLCAPCGSYERNMNKKRPLEVIEKFRQKHLAVAAKDDDEDDEEAYLRVVPSNESFTDA